MSMYRSKMKAMILLGLLTLFGCSGSPAEKACDEQIKAGLAAPSTYRRLKANVTDVHGGKSVLVEYEAKNEAGVPLRISTICTLNNADM